MKDTEIKQYYSVPECETINLSFEQSILSDPETGGNEGTGEEPIG